MDHLCAAIKMNIYEKIWRYGKENNGLYNLIGSYTLRHETCSTCWASKANRAWLQIKKFKNNYGYWLYENNKICSQLFLKAPYEKTEATFIKHIKKITEKP